MKKKYNSLSKFKERKKKAERSVTLTDLIFTLLFVVIVMLRTANTITLNWVQTCLIAIGLGIFQGIILLKITPKPLRGIFDGFCDYTAVIFISITVASLVIMAGHGIYYLIYSNEISLVRIHQGFTLFNGIILMLVKDLIASIIYSGIETLNNPT